MNLTLQTIPSPVISEILSDSKLDGVVLDTEHGYFNNETLYSCIQVITLSNKKCFVRLTDFNKQLVRMCLDAGVDGLIFSTMEDESIAYKIISYCNFPSNHGQRGCGLVRDNKWGKLPLNQKKPIIIAQIETSQAVENLDSLSKVPFDYFIIGPYDLSSSLGKAGDFEFETFNNYMQIIYKKISIDKLGLFLPTFDNMQTLSLEKRPKLLIWGMDTNFIIDSIERIKI
jgi:2-keto-3-deoxy-L-rhamnonate aldolase RhmA